ncbi:MAG: type II toxin-antitoxin system RelE/ParE family toxin [Bdellovibrionaceae bacterium]|nr:type II toxin-antitoxin system RelE/ParE family toxin [Pseudobdellovibrionaceae bacterium]
MKILQTNLFYKSIKKLHRNQKQSLNKVIQKIIKNPAIGSIKKGDLADVKVYKFKILKQTTLLAYTHNTKNKTLTLLAFDVHENFYRDLKKSKK